MQQDTGISGSQLRRTRSCRRLLEVEKGLTNLVPHVKQAAQCPHGRKKESLGASKHITQRRRRLLLASPSSFSGFPSMEATTKPSHPLPLHHVKENRTMNPNLRDHHLYVRAVELFPDTMSPGLKSRFVSPDYLERVTDPHGQ